MRRLATTLLVLLIASSAIAAEDTIRRGFNVSDGGTLRLDANIGTVTIVTGGSGVAVEVIRTTRGFGRDQILENHQVEFEQNGNDVTITSSLTGWRNRMTSDYRVKWNIRVPARYNVSVRTSGGSVSVSDIRGAVDVRTSGGSIKTGAVDGTANLRTSGGSISIQSASREIVAHTSGGGIRVERASSSVDAKTSGGSIHLGPVGGTVVARTSGGGITLEEVQGSIDAVTSGGSIHARLAAQPTASSRLSTSGGRVNVELGPNVAVDLEARASGGGVQSDIPVTVHGTIRRNEIIGQINGGGPKLVLRTSGGGIRLSRL
jgi:hypothetical protein